MMKLHKNRNSGFTLVEALATAAILIILLGLSAVGVARWRDPLKITELDNAARAIYMAAENRAVLLQNSGAAVSLLTVPDTPDPGDLTSSSATDALPDGTEQSVDLCVLSNTTKADILNELLPVGVIDPTLREGHFYILYDQSTYHVFEVFYAEKPFLLSEKEEDMKTLRGSRSQRVSYYRGDTANRCLVGHYAGGLAGQIGAKPLPTPGVEVLITNGNELTLTVKYTIPKDLPSGVKYSPSVRLDYPGATPKKDLLSVNDSGMIIPVNGGRLIEEGDFFIAQPGDIVTYTWTLDSLAQDDSGKFTKQFKGLFSNPDTIAFGGKFTVTASLRLSADGYLDSSFSDQGTDNSLFDTTSTDNTAKIANLRHLQNLDNVTSGAAQKTKAVQLANINASEIKDNTDTVKRSNYEFIPIENWDLESYEGCCSNGTEDVQYTITNLKVTEASAGRKNGGLFSGVGGFKFLNVRLADSEIIADKNAGALVGSAPGTTFINCWVYDTNVNGSNGYAGGLAAYWWKDDTYTEPIRFERCGGKDLEVTSYDSAGGLVGFGANAVFADCTVENISVTVNGWANAGGLAGSENGGATFTNCRVFKAEVNGSKHIAGGLVGFAEGKGTANAQFTNCTTQDVTVKGSTYAGGLVGLSVTESVDSDRFKDCKVVNANVQAKGDASDAGGLVGRATQAVFEGCTAEGSTVNSSFEVNGKLNVGGLVGYGESVNLNGCKTTNASVDAVTHAGGLIGTLEGGRLIDCETVNAKATSTNWNSDAGGLIANGRNVTLTACKTVKASVIAENHAGGLVGISEIGTLTGCEAVNANVSSGKTWNGEAGGLVGATEGGATLNQCRVYWDDRSLLTNNEDYQIFAQSAAGGMVGVMRGGGTITESFSATLVKGALHAGGLVGELPAEESTVTVKRSYADCYLYAGAGGEAHSSAGGLIGVKDAGNVMLTLNLEDVYAAGFIKMGAGTAAGLCGGWNSDKTTIKNAYAAVHYINATTIYALAGNIFPTSPSSDPNHLYFLESAPDNVWLATPYDAMRNIPMGSAFTKPALSTVPYNLDGENRETYPFPGLVDLPHYGDWYQP